jgi:hypothetical protein
MICEPCKQGRHRDCELGECRCPSRKEDEAVEQSLLAVRRSDSAYAEAVLSTLQYSGSPIARLIIEGAGREQARAFVCEIIATARAINC